MKKTKIKEAYFDALLEEFQNTVPYAIYSEEAILQFKDYLSKEALIIIDVSDMEEKEVSEILWCNFYRWDLYQGNPFMEQEMFH